MIKTTDGIEREIASGALLENLYLKLSGDKDAVKLDEETYGSDF